MNFLTAAREAGPVSHARSNREVGNGVFCHDVAVLVVELDLL
jgi:hypothetical protein